MHRQLFYFSAHVTCGHWRASELVNDSKRVIRIRDPPAQFLDDVAVIMEITLDPPIASALMDRTEGFHAAPGHGSEPPSRPWDMAILTEFLAGFETAGFGATCQPTYQSTDLGQPPRTARCIGINMNMQDNWSGLMAIATTPNIDFGPGTTFCEVRRLSDEAPQRASQVANLPVKSLL
jgi:hypothetical protein